MPQEQRPDEQDAAFHALIAHNAIVRAQRERSQRRRRAIRAAGWAAVVGALALVGLGVALLAGAFGSDSPRTSTAAAPPPATTTASPPTTAPAAVTTVPPPPAPKPAPLVFAIDAVRGDSWVEVRVGSETGRILYSGILRRGSSARLKGERLWVRFGSVGNLDLTLDGKPVRTAHSGTVNALVTRTGLR